MGPGPHRPRFFLGPFPDPRWPLADPSKEVAECRQLLRLNGAKLHP